MATPAEGTPRCALSTGAKRARVKLSERTEGDHDATLLRREQSCSGVRRQLQLEEKQLTPEARDSVGDIQMWKVYPTDWKIPPGFEPDLGRFIIGDCPTKEDALQRAFQRMATGYWVCGKLRDPTDSSWTARR